MQKYKILWADDEIDLLKPHIIFLEHKGYDMVPVTSGSDALDRMENEHFDLVFLDENMPGINGLDVLNRIKSTYPNTPVIMITKNDEEDIMEEAIGSKIGDYLIKPINPSQILLAIKKILDNQRIISEKTNLYYQQHFGELSMAVADAKNINDWIKVYEKIVYWDLQINETTDKNMIEVLSAQKTEANSKFSNFITNHYEQLIKKENSKSPYFSHTILLEKVFSELGNTPAFLIVIDNLRYDQWKILSPIISSMFNIISEELYCAILPTTTSYARNALFAGMTPLEISLKYPKFWVGENVDENKNSFEKELLEINLHKNRIKTKISYQKILKMQDGKNLVSNVKNLMSNNLNVVVFNFVDMLSHARTDVPMVRELTPDESAYRSVTKSWFEHSSLFELLKILSEKKIKIFITTDHGTIKVKKAQKIIGDRQTNTNLRYKIGRNLKFDHKNVFFSRNPEKIGLPQPNVSSTYIFAKEDQFFVYPNSFNHYARYYKNTFQHGGVSMDEMLIPFIALENK